MTSLILLKSMLYANVLHKTKKKKIAMKPRKISSSKLKICRICNQEKGEIPIFNNFLQPNIPEEINNFSGITIIKSDKLPKKMCKNCLDLLNGCIMFREMCQMSNKKLIEISVKEEYNNYEDTGLHQASDESYNIPSPNFSDHNSEIWEKWDCSSCCKEFLDLESYNDHLIKCSNYPAPKNIELKSSGDITKRSFLCDICGKTARSNANLLVHMYVYLNYEYPQKRHEIKKYLPVTPHLDIRSTHENNFPFKCDSCPYQGRTMDLLKVHKRTHMVDKPFKCTQCTKSTTTASNLAKHMRHVHSTNRPHKCTYCDKAFSYQHDVKRHIRDIHLRQGTVECDICRKKFNTKKILHGHRWKVHKIKGERHGRLPSYLQCQVGREREVNT